MPEASRSEMGVESAGKTTADMAHEMAVEVADEMAVTAPRVAAGSRGAAERRDERECREGCGEEEPPQHPGLRNGGKSSCPGRPGNPRTDNVY